MIVLSEPPGAPKKLAAIGDIGPRVASAIVMASLALGTLWVGGEVYIAFWAAAGLALNWEWQCMIDAPALRPRLALGGMAILAAAFFAQQMSLDTALLCLLAAMAPLAWFGGADKRLWSGFGVLYAGAPVMATICLRQSLEGFDAILWLFAVVWGTDVMAYFGGRLIGGAKLWPEISPGKTWSGFVVGVLCGSFSGIAALWASGGLSRSSGLWLLAVGLAAAMIAQGGDLFESAVKRRFGVKDSSRLIPGHGGFMDRLDGFIAAVVAIALLGGFRTGPLELAIGALRW